MTPEREAEIRRWLGPGPYATHGAEAIVADLLAAYDSERVARSRSEHAWADERDETRRQRDEARAALATRVALRREVEALLGVDSEDASDEQFARGVAALRAVMNGSAVRSARASERDAVRRAGDAEERAEWLGRMLDAAAAERDEWALIAQHVCDADPAKPKATPPLLHAITDGIRFANKTLRALRDDLVREREALRAERDEARAALASEKQARHAAADALFALRAREGWDLAQAVAERDEARAALDPLPYEYGSGPPTRSAKGVPASEIAANQVPSQPGVIAKLTAPSIEERVAALEEVMRAWLR